MVEKIKIEKYNVAQKVTRLAQCCVTGHLGWLGVIIKDAKPADTLLC